MATFEVEINGETYEVEAPDERAAVGAAQQFAGQPAPAPSSPMDQLRSQISDMYGFNKPAPVPASGELRSDMPGQGLTDAGKSLMAATAGAQDIMTLNLGDELFSGAVGLPQVVFNGLTGKGWNMQPVTDAYNQGTDIRQHMQSLDPGAYDVGSTLGGLGLMGKARGAAPSVPPSVGKTALTAGGYGATAGFGSGESLDERIRNAAAGGGMGAATGWVLGKYAAPRKAATPTVQGLLGNAKASFKAAESTGTIIPQKEIQSYATNLRNALNDEGLITPSGIVADFPKVSYALKLADDYAAGSITIKQAMTMRKALRRAAASTDPEERRLGVAMLDQFDSFMEKSGGAASKAWAAGRQTYGVAKRGESVEKLIATADRKKHKFSGSGYENALRTQFDSFVGKDRNLRGFNPSERAQLERVAKGTVGGNLARGVGKAAPTGVVSAGLSGGVPFLVGNAIGGPAMGAAFAGGSLGVGMIGRAIATLSTRHQAELARIIVLNGGKLPTKIPPGLPGPVRKAMGNIILAGGANSPKLAEWVQSQVSSQRPSTQPAQPALQ
jgi:hypothetical protein